MSFDQREQSHNLVMEGSVILLGMRIILDEIRTSSDGSDCKSLSKGFVSAMLVLQEHYRLVVSEDDEGIADYGLVENLVRQSGVAIQFNQYLNREDIAYTIHPGHSVSFSHRQAAEEVSSTLPGTLTLHFHNYRDIAAWIVSHPQPYRQLEAALADGAQKIRDGALVAFPTETVYGLGADATNPIAVEQIFAAKKRPLYDPLIVHVGDQKQMDSLVTEIPERAEQLMKRFWPGPLTIVLPKSPLVPSIVTAGTPTVAVRMPSNPIALALIRLSGKPIAAPSANLFGYTSPTTAMHVHQQLGDACAAIIDGGACTVGIESTVISFLGETPKILRPGGIDQQAIESCIGPVRSDVEEVADASMVSPGLMPSHYATTTPLWIVDDLHVYASRSDVGVLLFGESGEVFHGPVEYLSKKADPAEAANRLYQAMRRLDGKSLSLLVVRLLPETGIGIAVNNRLRKAAVNTASKKN